eukprot:365069-Chlamydomonas_euryale.AAC.29
MLWGCFEPWVYRGSPAPARSKPVEAGLGSSGDPGSPYALPPQDAPHAAVYDRRVAWPSGARQRAVAGGGSAPARHAARQAAVHHATCIPRRCHGRHARRELQGVRQVQRVQGQGGNADEPDWADMEDHRQRACG